mmetsp:Transcript_81419/g.217754  ORF Transcript_81419/g.217754 Transcript_81419/m.217754 type:complete len:862 (-) Transcript_81419:273-2858(-)
MPAAMRLLAAAAACGAQGALQLHRGQGRAAAASVLDADLQRLGRLLDQATELVWENAGSMEEQDLAQLENTTSDLFTEDTPFTSLLQDTASTSCSAAEASACRLERYDQGIFLQPPASTTGANLLQAGTQADDDDDDDAPAAEEDVEEGEAAEVLSKQVQAVLSAEDQAKVVAKLDQDWKELQREVPELSGDDEEEEEQAPEEPAEEPEHQPEEEEEEPVEEDSYSLFSAEDNALLQGVDTPVGNTTQAVALLAVGARKLTPMQRITKVTNSVLKRMKTILRNTGLHADRVMKNIDVAVAAVPSVKLVWKSYKQALTALYKSGSCMNTGNFMCGLNRLNAFFSKKATAARVKAFCAVARKGLKGAAKARKIRRCLKAGMQGAMLSAVGAGGPIRNMKYQARVMSARAKRAKGQARRKMLQARRKKGKARKTLLAKAAKLRVFARKSKMAAGLLRYKRKKTLAAKVGLLRLRKSMKNLRKVRKTMMRLLARIKKMASVKSQAGKLKSAAGQVGKIRKKISSLKKARGVLKLQISGAKKRCKALKRQAKMVRSRQKRRLRLVSMYKARRARFAKGLKWRRAKLARVQRKIRKEKKAWRKRQFTQKANSLKRTIARVAGRHKRASNALARTILAQRKARARLIALVKRIRACRKARRARRAQLNKIKRGLRKQRAMLRRRGRSTKKLSKRVTYQNKAKAAYKKLIGAKGMKPGAKVPGFKRAVNRLGKLKAGHFYKIYHPDGARDFGFVVPLSNKKMCMTVSGTNVVVAKCNNKNKRQKWYQDKWGRMVSMATKTCVIFNTKTWNLSMGGCRQTAQDKFSADTLNRIHVFLRPRLCAAVSGTNVVMQNCVAGRKQSWDFPQKVR